jgi:outer membrane protein assembly factor BamB
MTMRGCGAVVAVVAVLTALSAATAQPPRSATYTRPELLPPEVLNRLNLRTAWSTYIPTDGVRDGLQSVEVIPPDDLLVQTRSGLTVLLDAETGETRWRSRVGIPYRVVGHPVANSHNVFVINNTLLFALDRATGAVQWQHRLPGGITAPPAVDDEFIYFATANGRLHSYILPTQGPLPANVAAAAPPSQPTSPLYEKNKKTTGAISHLTSVREAGAEVVTGPQPFQFWEYATNVKVEVAPVVTPTIVFVVTPEGRAMGITRIPDEGQGPKVVFEFQADGPVAVRPGHFLDSAYLACSDGTVYAISLRSGRILWRHTGGGGAERTPAAMPKDVYVATRANGLTRLDAVTGLSQWRVPRGSRVLDSNVEADRFLAENPKFVYAADRLGRLQVLDRRLGHRLSGWDTRDFVVPVRNEITDRAYLAANNGLIVCLHDREYPTPIQYRRLEADLPTLMRRLLAQPVTEQGDTVAPLSDVLTGLRNRYSLKIEVDARAFKDAGLPPIEPIPVKFPRVENRPLSEVLQLILDQVAATYRLAGDTIRIVPAPAKAKGP